MNAEKLPLQKILFAANRYLIPVFQRFYVWKKENWDQLWEDIIFLLESPEADREHFMGAIACVPEPNQPSLLPAYQVIDGQQRLITVTVLLCALRDAATNRGWKQLAEMVEESYLIHKFNDGQERYKVFPRSRDRDSYLALIDRTTQTTSSKILEAHAYFSDKLERTGILESSDTLKTFLNTVVKRLDFVVITLEKENPYKIFKSLNSTGVELEQSDLIRNHIFMAMTVVDQDIFADKQWRMLESHFIEDGELNSKVFTAFFRDVLMAHGDYVGMDDVFEEFEKKHPLLALKDPLSNLKPGQVVTELEQYARYYDIIRGKTEHASEEVNQAIWSIRSLDVKGSYPLALNLLALHDVNKLALEDLASCLRIISGFVLRRYVCAGGGKAYPRWFCLACKGLGNDPLHNLTISLMQKEWPTDNVFIPTFQQFKLSEGKYCRAVLEAIERYLQADCEPVGLDKCWIEHILPQSVTDDADGQAWQAELGPEWRRIHQDWLHTPGNLTLVGNDYNIEMSKDSFAKKKPVLGKKSRVSLNRYFGDDEHPIEKWTEEAIRTRGLLLAEIASCVWPGPPSPNKAIGSPDNGGDAPAESEHSVGRRRAAPYPWSAWFAPGTITLVRGEDFDNTVERFLNTARQAAFRLGYSLSVRLNGGEVTLIASKKESDTQGE